MISDDIGDIKAALTPGQRLLGLDIGAKTIGLALSDASLLIASPAETIRRVKFTQDADRLGQVIDANQVGGLILGLPVSMDGSEGPACQSVRQFAQNLAAKIDIAIGFWDERLSTSAVERVLIEVADLSRKRRAQVIDKVAAAYILQGALDALAAR